MKSAKEPVDPTKDARTRIAGLTSRMNQNQLKRLETFAVNLINESPEDRVDADRQRERRAKRASEAEALRKAGRVTEAEKAERDF